MNSAVQMFLFCSAGFVMATLGLICIAPGHTAQFLENLAYFEALAGALCFVFKDKL